MTAYSSYDFLKSTLSYLLAEPAKMSDDDIDEVLEELEGDHYTFLHEYTVDKCIVEGFIPVGIKPEIIELRTQLMALYEQKVTVESYRTNNDWSVVRNKARRIMAQINKQG